MEDCIKLMKAIQYKRKTWNGKMIKNILIRRKESDIYLATVRRLRWSLQVPMKVDKMCSSLPLQLMKATVRAKSYTFYLLSLRPADFSDVFWQFPGRCRCLSFLLIYFYEAIVVYGCEILHKRKRLSQEWTAGKREYWGNLMAQSGNMISGDHLEQTENYNFGFEVVWDGITLEREISI